MLGLLLAACATTPDDSGVEVVVIEAELLTVPEGTVLMGSDTDEADESPVHAVLISAFGLDKYEVTHAQYDACVEANACVPADIPGGPNEPVTGLSFDYAASYCLWRDARLPSEAEWERAARGDDARRYPWGDDAPTCDLAASRPCDAGLVNVGEHPDGAGPFGHHDLGGNAWEWVADLYDPAYYEQSPDSNPTGPPDGGLRIVRGTDSYSDPEAQRVSNRTYAIPTGAGPLVGARCAGNP